MTSKKIKFRDPVVERVVDKFVSRSDVGFKKYGTTLHEERTQKVKGLLKYLQDIQEELMDAVLYIQTAREEIEENYTYIKWNKSKLINESNGEKS